MMAVGVEVSFQGFLLVQQFLLCVFPVAHFSNSPIEKQINYWVKPPTHIKSGIQSTSLIKANPTFFLLIIFFIVHLRGKRTKWKY